MKNLMLIMIMAMMALSVKAQPANNDDVKNPHEWVDLGLPSGTLWATMNVGASSPEDCGYYFAWGETSTKDAYDWSTYIWCNGSENTLTKYCSDKDYGEVDNRTLLLPEDDAATVNWGAAWRMPTEAQMQELITRCKWTTIEINGVDCCRVTGPNGATLILPESGVRSEVAQNETEQGGYYWSSESPLMPECAGGLSFGSGNRSWGIFYRYGGLCVRAVRVQQSPN